MFSVTSQKQTRTADFVLIYLPLLPPTKKIEGLPLKKYWIEVWTEPDTGYCETISSNHLHHLTCINLSCLCHDITWNTFISRDFLLPKWLLYPCSFSEELSFGWIYPYNSIEIFRWIISFIILFSVTYLLGNVSCQLRLFEPQSIEGVQNFRIMNPLYNRWIHTPFFSFFVSLSPSPSLLYNLTRCCQLLWLQSH